jgi:GNAT superfamily N-acetyltransferase
MTASMVGSLQLSFIPGLSQRGLTRGQIESVRVSSGRRGEGAGRRMIEWAIDQCRARGCGLVQLTTDKHPRAMHGVFMRASAFVASHEGMKLKL